MNDSTYSLMVMYRSLASIAREENVQLRIANENLQARLDDLQLDLDWTQEELEAYEDEEDRELDSLLAEALDELFPGELHDRKG